LPANAPLAEFEFGLGLVLDGLAASLLNDSHSIPGSEFHSRG